MGLKTEQMEFLSLVQGGLWGRRNNNTNRLLNLDRTIDWHDVYRLAREQTVQGLVLAGVECSDEKPPKEFLLQWIGEVQLLEQRNKELNGFVAELIDGLRKENVYCLLVKGQGVAQCYEKPLWRESGDIDLLLTEVDYKRTKTLLTPMADEVHIENEKNMHLSMNMKGYVVELHGKMPFLLSKRVDRVIDDTLEDSLRKGGVMAWKLGEKDVLLPNPDSHIFIVFTHFLHHFFIEGVGLRQICDWCRSLYTYRDSLDCELLESRIKAMGLISEWKAFASLAVDTLGMPKEAMPLYDRRFVEKGRKVLKLVLKAGNFGHNKDLSYRVRYKGFVYKLISLCRRFYDFCFFVTIFPIDAPRFYITYVTRKIK